MKYIKTLCITSLVASSLLADMSLDQAVELTLKNNPDVISKGYNNKAYKGYIRERKGAYLPTIDLTAGVGAGREKIDYDNGAKTDEHLSGPSAGIALNQVVFDKTKFSQTDRAEHQYLANRYKNLNDIETVLLNSIDSYLNIAKYQNRIKKTEDFLAVLNKNYAIAKKTQAISKEILDKVQTKSKILSSKNTLMSENSNLRISKSYFLKNVGVKAEGSFNEPDTAAFALPELDVLKKQAVENNFRIKSQLETIKEQIATISEEEGSFYPTLYVKLNANYDDDISNDEAKTKTYNAKLELKYNLFNGLINQTRVEREKVFLREAEQELNVITQEVLNNLTSSYDSYKTSKEQLGNIKELIASNAKIVKIYKDQFNSGTRSFIDLLNVQLDLYNAKVDLINTRKTMHESYYKVLNSLSALQSTFAKEAE